MKAVVFSGVFVTHIISQKKAFTKLMRSVFIKNIAAHFRTLTSFFSRLKSINLAGILAK